MSLNKYFSLNNKLPVVFFFGLFVLGLSIYKDYGVSVDEPLERTNGIVALVDLGERLNLESIKGNPFLKQYIKSHFVGSPVASEYKPYKINEYRDRYYPVGFTLPSVMLERWLSIEDEVSIYHFRHLMNFVVCFLGLIALYSIAKRRYSSWKIGILAVLLFMLSPRFFAESFYNSKDLILVSLFLIVTNSMIALILRPRIITLLMHALLCAIAMDIRLMAIIFPIGTLTLLGILALRGQVAVVRVMLYASIYSASVIFFVVLLWPFLWPNPWQNFLEAFVFMTRYKFEMTSLYLGDYFPSDQLPWHYLPVWIGLTTPLPYIGFFFLGVLVILGKTWKNKWSLWKNAGELQDLIFLVLSLGPVLAIVILNSTLYDSWRHVYFVYPYLILVAVRGLVCLWDLSSSHKLWKYGLTILVSITLGYIGLWMIKAHPLQNVYFNVLAGSNLKERFDLDYWGLANKLALERIAMKDSRPDIRVYADSFTPLYPNLYLRPEMQRFSISPVKEGADYIINNWRLHSNRKADPNFKIYDEITVDGEVILTILKAIKSREYTPIKLNQTLHFNRGGDGIQYLMSVGLQERVLRGWSEPEAWGVWSQGVAAGLAFQMPSPHPKKLVINMKEFVSPLRPAQSIDIYVNGRFLRNVNLTQVEGNQIELMFDGNDKTEYLAIEFRFRNPEIPKEIGISDDNRLLSIGLVSAKFQ